MASDPGSWNRYAYVGGDPVNRRDPRGTCWVSDNGNQVEDATVTDQDAMAGYGYHHVDASCGGSFSTTVTDSAPDPEPDPCNGTDGGCAPTTIESPVSDPAEPQGGGGGGNLYVSNFSNTGQSQATITSALGKINVLLPGDSDCSQWLGGLNVVGSLVGGLIDGNAYGSATLPSNVNTIAAFEGSKNPDGSSVGVPVTAAFTVNSNGAFFNSGFTVGPKQYQGGTVQAQLFVVLHELAHMLQTNGLGAPGFQNDFGNAAAGRSNDGLIDNHCGDLINHWY